MTIIINVKRDLDMYLEFIPKLKIDFSLTGEKYTKKTKKFSPEEQESYQPLILYPKGY